MGQYDALLKPLVIKGLTIRNRVLSTSHAPGYASGGRVTERYVRYHEEEERDPTLRARAQEAFRELESGVEGPVRATWRRLTELSLREFDAIYRRLGVRFDEIRGESYYEPYLGPTIERIVAAGITEESQGALIVDLSSSGAAVRLSEHLNIVQDEVRVVFRLTVGDDEVLVEARARAVRKPEQGNEPFMGVAFTSLALSERLALQAFVQTQLVRELEIPLYAN